MAVKVRIPTPLRKLTNQESVVEVEGTNVLEVIDGLESKYQGIKARLCDEEGNVRRFVNIFVNEEDIRFMKGTETEVKDGDEVSIVPAIAGGRN
ncbi:MAG: MoaD/ThiS family protein [Candidatus Schekmanbacteria bacterium]|nr:MAG: MoaD/ThiS family protein [Candidatus Schekmanbacteria bacterium]